MKEIHDKNELLKNIQVTKKLLLQWEELEIEMQRYHIKPINLNYKHHIGFAVATVFLSSFLFYGLFETEISENIVFPGAIIVYAIFALIFIPNYNAKVVNAKRTNNSNRITEIRLIQRSLVEALSSESVVPQSYWEVYAIESFEKYITNQRADNLKECINLFEEDIKHSERIHYLQNIQIQQEQLVKEMKNTQSEIRTNSFINLFK